MLILRAQCYGNQDNIVNESVITLIWNGRTIVRQTNKMAEQQRITGLIRPDSDVRLRWIKTQNVLMAIIR
jgi:hypothetical protein